MSTDRIELIQPILGMKPYVLIEAHIDPADSELVLQVQAGGGAEEQVSALPFMLVAQLPAGDNPITEGIAQLLRENPEANRETLVKLANVLNVPMPEVA